MSRSRKNGRREENVFVNCPFDDGYQDLFDAIIFAICDCGFIPRCALESSDSGQVRIEKILAIIGECQFGIHDISRTELSESTKLPRFNMPLELGLFLGATHFGRDGLKRVSLILDRTQYRYHKFCSDIGGQDIAAHGGKPGRAVKVVRDWLQTNWSGSAARIPDGSTIFDRYRQFLRELPQLSAALHLHRDRLIFPDYLALVSGWLRKHDWRPVPTQR
jgi:hypothetical protein